MPKNLLKRCVSNVLDLFVSRSVYEPPVFDEFYNVENTVFYTNYLTSLWTVFCRNSGGILRGNY